MPTVWIDVEDFLDYFRTNPQPSGIQRVSFELNRALCQVAGDRIRFVRRGPASGSLEEVAWAELTAAMGAARPAGGGRKPPPGQEPANPTDSVQAINTLPSHLRDPLLRAGLLQSHAARQWRALVGAFRRPPPPAPVKVTPRARGAPATPASGDRFLVLGAPWSVPGFADHLAALKRRYGVSAHLLLHDLIPVRHREWCTPHAVALFETWLDASLTQFDGLLAVSQHTASDVEAYARERSLSIAAPVRPVRLGTGFAAQTTEPAPAGLPAPGSYVLFVSTIEVRKNHALMFRLWRRLADEVRTGVRNASALPTLIFAGRIGWLVSDLLQQLENANWLDGRIRLLTDPSDAELGALYAGCLFTVLPSWFEGWGLPVTESLAAGKPCLAACATALPEAGGELCRYFDPGSLDDAYRAVTALLDEPAILPAWQAQVRAEFRPVPWTRTAGTVLESMAP